MRGSTVTTAAREGFGRVEGCADRGRARRPGAVLTLARRGEARTLEDCRERAREHLAGGEEPALFDAEAMDAAATIAAMDPSLPARLWLVAGDRLRGALAPYVDLEACRAAGRARIAD